MHCDSVYSLYILQSCCHFNIMHGDSSLQSLHLQSCCHFNIMHCDSVLQSLHFIILLPFQHYVLWLNFTVFTSYNLAAILTLCRVIEFYSLYILYSCCHFNIMHCDSVLHYFHLIILLPFQHYALGFSFTVFTSYNRAAISTLCTVIQFYSLSIL